VPWLAFRRVMCSACSGPRTGRVREVPAAGRASGAEEAGSGVEPARVPLAGHFTKCLAEDWLREVLHQARQGTLAGQVRTGVTFADAAAEWLRYVELDRQRKPSTIAGYRVIVRS
jgi:hypothetical protein